MKRRREVHARDALLPPSMISAASFGVVLRGASRIDTRAGKLEAVAGRLGDLADGIVARHGLRAVRSHVETLPADSPAHELLDDYEQWTGSRDTWESDTGAIIDASLDKLGLLALGVQMWRHDVAPKPALATILLKHSINSGATLYNGLRDPAKRAIRPPASGKLSMAADNLALAAFAVAHESEQGSRTDHAARAIGWTAVIAGTVIGLRATHKYLDGEFDDESPSS